VVPTAATTRHKSHESVAAEQQDLVQFALLRCAALSSRLDKFSSSRRPLRSPAPPAATGRKSGLMQCKKKMHYSITSSARSGNAGGMFNPRAFAVLRLITSSNLVGA